MRVSAKRKRFLEPHRFFIGLLLVGLPAFFAPIFVSWGSLYLFQGLACLGVVLAFVFFFKKEHREGEGQKVGSSEKTVRLPGWFLPLAQGGVVFVVFLFFSLAERQTHLNHRLQDWAGGENLFSLMQRHPLLLGWAPWAATSLLGIGVAWMKREGQFNLAKQLVSFISNNRWHSYSYFFVAMVMRLLSAAALIFTLQTTTIFLCESESQLLGNGSLLGSPGRGVLLCFFTGFMIKRLSRARSKNLKKSHQSTPTGINFVRTEKKD